MKVDPWTCRVAFAGVSALTVLTWYALPDAVRSRRARGVRCAQTPTAVAMALVTGAGALVDWTKLARNLTNT